jgi:hypothetical protein
MATADLAEGPRDVGVGDTPQEAVRATLRGLGERYAGEMAEGVEHQDPTRQRSGWVVTIGTCECLRRMS